MLICWAESTFLTLYFLERICFCIDDLTLARLRIWMCLTDDKENWTQDTVYRVALSARAINFWRFGICKRKSLCRNFWTWGFHPFSSKKFAHSKRIHPAYEGKAFAFELALQSRRDESILLILKIGHSGQAHHVRLRSHLLELISIVAWGWSTSSFAIYRLSGSLFYIR